MTNVLHSASYIERYLNHQDPHASSQLPIIFDGESDYRGDAELVETEENGLLAKASLAEGFFPMSGYNRKPSYPNSKEYEGVSRSELAMYLAPYAQPNLAQPNLTQSHGLSILNSYPRQTEEVPFSNSNASQPRAYLETSASQYTTGQARGLPQVQSYQPQIGPGSTKIFVTLLSAYDLNTSSTLNFYAMFASRRCPTTIRVLEPQGSYKYQYMLAVDVPAFNTTGWHDQQVPLRLQVQDESGLDLGILDCGTFTYTDAVQQPPQLSPQHMSRKRKISVDDSAEGSRLPPKRTSSQQFRPSNPEIYGMQQQYLPQADSSYLPQSTVKVEHSSLDMEATTYGSLIPPPFGRSQSQPGYHIQESPRRVSHHLSTSSGSSYSQIRGHSPQTPSWSPSTITVSHPGKSPHLTAPAHPRQMSSPSAVTTPRLIRTSTLQQDPSPAEAQTISAPFNPYNIYPHHKAILRIDGDLETMMGEWNEDEWEVKRRLVQFWRSQSGNTIHTNFKPVAPEDRPPNSICISCIYWESKKDWFVTSVDTIYLLESLVAVRFTVEEKNRIRRNLEGFRPITVSKGKADSEDFFKLIMGFPNPKPRNIEKDVKVFPWKILAHALNKIIGKYSASYSSTASTISTSANSTYQSTAAQDQGLTSASYSASASPYTAAATETSNGAHKRTISYTPARPGLLQIPGPEQHPYQIPISSTMESSAGGLAMMQPQVHRASWDFTGMPYADNGSGASTGVTSGLHEMSYYPLRTGGNGGATTAYQMTHSSSGI